MLVVGGQKLVRAGLRLLLEGDGDIVVAAEAAGGHDAVALAREVRPDVVLMNIHLPGLDGLDVTRRIVAHPDLSEVEVLLLSEDENDEDLFRGLRAGATGFVVIKDADPGELLRAVRIIASGGVQLSPAVARRLLVELTLQPREQPMTPDLFEQLTVREQEVVGLVSLGLTNGEIAQRLTVSPATAKTHVSRSMVKLGVRDRAKLVALAYQTGFAQAPA
ncbi:MAG TPA: response regulator transcription factor [Solirubrobacteraceae bacterium]|nr:response regulator transcription factor [Solirubrobacteraceae bacterium]